MRIKISKITCNAVIHVGFIAGYYLLICLINFSNHNFMNTNNLHDTLFKNIE